MDTLSSCYFCGSALDASLSEYPVVPKQLRIEDRDSTTVVLCDPCREKLATIIEEVVEATAVDETIDMTAVDGDTETTTSTVATDRTNEVTAEATESASKAQTARPTEDGSQPSDDTPDQTDDHTAETEPAADDDPSLSRLEYNKVMRLLQNRQFPVDRGEIRDVAVSAYDVDPSEFDAVVDTAIDRGLIAERNGQFVDPE